MDGWMDGWVVEYNGSGACMCVEQGPLHKMYKHVLFCRHTPNEVSMGWGEMA